MKVIISDHFVHNFTPRKNGDHRRPVIASLGNKGTNVAVANEERCLFGYEYNDGDNNNNNTKQ